MATKLSIDVMGLAYAKKFTEAYKKGSEKNIYEREILCENVQFPAILVPPGEDDYLCGRRLYPEVGYSPQYGGLGYYFDTTSWEAENPVARYTHAELAEWMKLKAFWSKERTEAKCWNHFDPVIRQRMPEVFGDIDPAPAYPLYRMGGLQLDYAKLVRLGVPGLKAELQQKRDAAGDDEARLFYKTAIASVERIERSLIHLAGKAGELKPTQKNNKMIEVLTGLTDHAPRSFYEALQLVLLVQTMTGTLNFGRLDTVLGPFLARDQAEGRIVWSQALDLMKNLYVIIEDQVLHFDGRITVGGAGRENEKEADVFAMLAMETTDSLSLPMPQLSLRFYDGQNPELLEKGYEVISHGKTFPMLYNDEVNIPAVQKAFNVDERTAAQYIPFGCGEYIINHQSCGTPNCIINVAMTLELAMNNGKSIVTGKSWAPDYGSITDCGNFDALWDAYTKTTEYFLEAGALAQDSIYKTSGGECPFSLISILYDDCIERGRPIFKGGVRYLGGTNETYGNNNAADSLTAVHELLYNKKAYTAAELLGALTDNWIGHENMLQDFKDEPKFGNDDEVADSMVERVHNHICLETSRAAQGTDLHHFLVVVINNNTNTVWGKTTAASPDGRKNGEPLAPGNAASAGADRNGITALLNSQAKPDVTIHAGAVQNVKITSGFPEKKRDLFMALFAGYWRQGGAQTMVTVTKREDLEAALEHPGQYANLLVRVGGFSARFVDLDRATQMEILSRTEYTM